MTTLADLLTYRIADRMLEHERQTGRVELIVTELDLDLIRSTLGVDPGPARGGALADLDGIPVSIDPAIGSLLLEPPRCDVCGARRCSVHLGPTDRSVS